MHNGAEDLSNCSEEENDPNEQWCGDDQLKDGQNHLKSLSHFKPSW